MNAQAGAGTVLERFFRNNLQRDRENRTGRGVGTATSVPEIPRPGIFMRLEDAEEVRRSSILQ